MLPISGHAHVMSAYKNFQNTNSPDVDLDRDVIIGSALLDEQVKNNKRFQFNVATIIMSALIFLAILAWFDFMQTTFYSWLAPDSQVGNPSPAIKLYYALLATGVVAACCLLIVIYSDSLRV